MDIEQLPPNKPNFKLIVGLFVVAIIVILIAAYFFLHHEAHTATHSSKIEVKSVSRPSGNLSTASSTELPGTFIADYVPAAGLVNARK